MNRVVKRDYDKVTFTAKRRGNHPETGELGMYHIADIFLHMLQDFLFEINELGIYIEVLSVGIDKDNINNKNIVLHLNHKVVKALGVSPCDLFWESYSGLENRVVDVPPDGLGVKIWR